MGAIPVPDGHRAAYIEFDEKSLTDEALFNSLAALRRQIEDTRKETGLEGVTFILGWHGK